MVRTIPFLICVVAGLGQIGCAGGGAVGMAQMAVSGVSYMATGKSAEDQVLSGLTGDDCRLARVLTSEQICQEPVMSDGRPTMADAAKEPARSAMGTIYADSLALNRARSAPVAGTPARTERYLVVASFDDARKAAQIADGLHRLPVKVAAARDGASVYHRILAGPVERHGEAGLRARLAAAGITGSWPVTLCRDTLRTPPCTPAVIALAPRPLEMPPIEFDVDYEMVDGPR